ncbi:amino acid permease [Haladaptatus caseinilyticus]|uniref:amino acid permease n=1 Tax=Haladaptatus caseinilyticus TaxID=2993314 RepID=UPI00224B12F5|nr:amino acid permease [Haladaptatus caseinilyticus]
MTDSSTETTTDSADIQTELDRDIGLVGAVALGVGTMIAAGIFVLSGLAVSNVGAAAIVSFLAAALVASFTAFAYAEFAAIYPESGGGYMYVANVFDTDLTYIVGWSMILGYPASAAFYLASFSDWFYRFIYPALSIPQAIPYWIAGLVVLALLVGVNLKGTEETGLFQIVVTGLKVALIILFLYGGLQGFDASVVTSSMTDNLNDLRQLGLTTALVFITFFGFEAIATNAEEIEKPSENIPRAIFISMGFVTVIYALVVVVIVLAVNNGEFLEFLAQQAGLSGSEAAKNFVAQNGEISMGRAAQYYLGDFGFYVIIVGALFSMLSAANATILAGSRVKLAMARRNHLPEQFEDLHPSLNTPYKSVLLTGGLITFYMVVFTVLLGTPPGAEEGATMGVNSLLSSLGVGLHVPHVFHLGLHAVTHFADFMLLGGLIFVNLALIQSRRKRPNIDRGFTVPFVPWVPIIAVIANLVLLVNVEPKAFVVGLLAQVIGIGFWFAWKATDPEETQFERATPTVVTEREPSDGREYQLAVPIANPEHVEQMMETAIDIAEDRNGELLVLSAALVPEQTPISESYRSVDEEREVLRKAMSSAEDSDVPVNGIVRIGHRASDAILHTVEQHDSDAVLIGWRGRGSHRREVVLGSTVDRVVEEAPCDVFVEKIGPQTADTDSVLVPTAGGPHAELASKAARAIARAEDATVEVAHVVPPTASDAERESARETLSETAVVLDGVSVTQSVLEGEDVAATIVERTDDHDLTVIGATRESELQQLVFGALPETVGQRAKSTVIMTKRNLGITSRFARWLQ